MAGIMTEEDKIFNSHDVVSHFTNTPTDKAQEIICSRLDKDSKLKSRTKLLVSDIMELSNLCWLQLIFRSIEKYISKCFVLQWVFLFLYSRRHVYGVPGQHAITTAQVTCALRLWKQYVNDTLEIIKKGHAEYLTERLSQAGATGSKH